ncbi:MAG: hypothetical protein JHD16_14420 [Solirubrobacteraceae bacterium]|nr:hypothetical protein [Solirubrobacteraceae bacterium]
MCNGLLQNTPPPPDPDPALTSGRLPLPNDLIRIARPKPRAQIERDRLAADIAFAQTALAVSGSRRTTSRRKAGLLDPRLQLADLRATSRRLQEPGD